MPSSISEYIINARRFKPKTSENEIVIGVTNRLAKDILLGGNKKWKTHLKYLLLDLCARYRETPLAGYIIQEIPHFIQFQPTTIHLV